MAFEEPQQITSHPTSTDIVVQGLQCIGSHGISVGSLGILVWSLGQYIGEFDIVEDVHVYNTSMTDASDGDRIKMWLGTDTPF